MSDDEAIEPLKAEIVRLKNRVAVLTEGYDNLYLAAGKARDALRDYCGVVSSGPGICQAFNILNDAVNE